MLTIETIKEEVEPIAKECGMRKVYLFGSYAKGIQTEESDVDLIIDNDPKMSLLIISRFMRKVKEALQLPVDVITERSITEEFAECISDSKVLIYEER